MRSKSIWFVATFVFGSSHVTIPSHAQAAVPDSPAIEQRLDSMLKKLTLEQKLELIGGVDGMFIRPEESAC